MTLCIHQPVPGLRAIEIINDDFVKTGTLVDAKKILTDNGMTPVSRAALLQDLWLPGPAQAASLETWKKRFDQFSTLGWTRIYCPSTTNRMMKEDDSPQTSRSTRRAK